MSISGWNQMADWWDEKLGDEGDLWHRTLIDPPLLQLVGDVKGVRLLDLACRPLERAGPGLIAEGLTEFLGLGEDLSDCLVYGAALLAQTDTPPKESCSSGGVLRVGDYARSGLWKSRGRRPAVAANRSPTGVQNPLQLGQPWAPCRF